MTDAVLSSLNAVLIKIASQPVTNVMKSQTAQIAPMRSAAVSHTRAANNVFFACAYFTFFCKFLNLDLELQLICWEIKLSSNKTAFLNVFICQNCPSAAEAALLDRAIHVIQTFSNIVTLAKMF